MTEKQIAKLIERTARDALFNGAGKIINPEIFTEAAKKIVASFAAAQQSRG